MEFLKGLLKDKRVLAMIVAGLVASAALLLKVPSESLKEAFCGAAPAAAPDAK